MNNLYVATRRGLFTLSNQNGRWEILDHIFQCDPVSMVLPDERDNTLYAALNLGHFGVKLHRLNNGETQWKSCAVPVYPPQPEDAEGSDWTLKQIWCLEAGKIDQPGRLWAGTIPGGLFRSDDRGDSWALNEALWHREERLEWFGGGYDDPGIHSVCVSPDDGKTLTVGVSCGGVWQTMDEGKTWCQCAHGMRAEYMPPAKTKEPNVQDPHRLVQCAEDTDKFWVQHHNGIFKSTDHSKSWQEIDNVKPSVFGFAVVVHPGNPEKAWFIPAVKDECRIPVDGALVVNRTEDGGKTFETLRKGLPQKHAYDLVLRHGMDISDDGETLAFGSTTGGLWVSDNQGHSWQCVSEHLPPVYCVRFGF